jgi:hypothetical protein
VGDIADYFIRNSEEFFLYLYPPSYRNKPSLFQYYKKGVLVNTTNIFIYRGNNKTVIHFFYYFLFLYLLIKYRIHHAFIIFHFPIFLFFNSLVSILTFNKYVFWLWDYFPGSTPLMKIHNKLVDHYNNNLKYVIYLSPSLEKMYTRKNSPNKLRRTISLGIKNIKVSRKPVKNLLGYVGNLRPGQGVEFLLDVIKKNKKFRLQLIGDGPSRKELEEYVVKNKIEKYVQFLGFVENKKMTNIIKRWEVAVAAYTPGKKVPAYYTDLGKLKLYVQYEIPILTSGVSYFYKEIVKYMAGRVIVLDYKNFLKEHAIIQNNYDKYCKGVSILKKAHLADSYYKERFNFIS